MQGHRDVSVFWTQCILRNVKSSMRKFPSQPEEEQCKYLSLVQAGGCSWRRGAERRPRPWRAGPGSRGRARPEPRERRAQRRDSIREPSTATTPSNK